MKKKGISPIISTVLIVAFVIVLSLLVFNWVQKNIVSESMEKTEEKLTGQLDCISTEIEIASACVDANPNPTKVSLNVDNTGDTNIDGLTIRIIDGDGEVGTADPTVSSEVPPLGRIISKNTEQAITGDLGEVVKIEVYPEVGGKLCKNQLDSVSSIKTC